jgi:hypothetical protein
VRNVVVKSCWICSFVVIAGCGLNLSREPERTMRAMIAAADDVADTLQSIRDADSARAATDTVDRKFGLLCSLLGKLPVVIRENPNARVSTKKFDELSQSMNSAFTRLRTEQERLDGVAALPAEFWKVLATHSLDFHIKYMEVSLPALTASIGEDLQFSRNVRDLRQKVGYEEVVRIEFANMRADLVANACERLQKLAPGATLHHMESDNRMRVELGPVKDFNVFASAVDFGDVVVRNESKRLLSVNVHRTKLGAKADTAEEENQLEAKQREERWRREAEERAARDREEAKQREAARIKEEGDPNAPDYYDKLAELATSNDVFQQGKAVHKLLQSSPSQVTFEQRKKIAKAFKQLAEDDRAPMREETIKGLVIWGGVYSGPILLEILEHPVHPRDEERAIKALGDIKYAKAAPALAAKLSKRHLHECVGRALRRLGEDAEDALIVVAPSPKELTCLAAVELLGDCGTKKCLPVLRRGASSRSMRIRSASKEAIRKVMARQNAANADDS